MTPKEIIRLADEAQKAATVAANKAAEFDAAVSVYWPQKGDLLPNPRWFAQTLRQQADVTAGTAHAMRLWTYAALTPARTHGVNPSLGGER